MKMNDFSDSPPPPRMYTARQTATFKSGETGKSREPQPRCVYLSLQPPEPYSGGNTSWLSADLPERETPALGDYSIHRSERNDSNVTMGGRNRDHSVIGCLCTCDVL